jgi:hypothetical protein
MFLSEEQLLIGDGNFLDDSSSSPLRQGPPQSSILSVTMYPNPMEVKVIFSIYIEPQCRLQLFMWARKMRTIVPTLNFLDSNF